MLAFLNFRDIPRPLRIQKKAADESGVTHLSAFSSEECLTYTVYIDRAFLTAHAMLRIMRDDDGVVFELPMRPISSSVPTADAFSLTLPLKDICENGTDGLFFCHVVADTVYGRLFSHGGDGEEDAWLTDDLGSADAAQLLVHRANYTASRYLGRGVMYQIFVDRFYRGGDAPPRADVVMAEWGDEISQFPAYPGAPVKNNLFYGGDLDGVRKKLPYLASLGVTVLYLCPIFEAASNHKYDTGDYMTPDPMFGGMPALDRLLRAAKRQGMRVILDGVFNHTGSDSRYFNKEGRYPDLGAYQSKDSPYYDWYRFIDYPNTYDCWWGVTILPAVNSKNQDFQDFIAGENGVVDTYAKHGVSGFRLDVADELDESLIRALRKRLKSHDRDAILIGEVWEDASNKIAYDTRRRYFRGDELDAVMNYPLKNAILAYILSGDSHAFATVSRRLYAHYPRTVSHAMMNLLGTHDTERILTVLGGQNTAGLTYAEAKDVRLTPEQREVGVARLRLAYAILAFMPGIPCIYYGDEVGMEGARDPFNRRTFPWGEEDLALLDFYRKIGALRKEYAAFFLDADYTVEAAEGDLLILSRKSGKKTVSLYLNRGGSPILYPLTGRGKNCLSGEILSGDTLIPACGFLFIEKK